MKKFLAILLAAMMLLATAGVAFAEEGEETTTPVQKTVVVNVSDHTFAAYQVFSGSQTADQTDGALGNIVWGTGVVTTDGSDEDTISDILKDLTDKFPNWEWPKVGETTTIDYDAITAKVVADLLQANATNANANAFAKIMYDNKGTTSTPIAAGTHDLAAGYYLIVDTTVINENGDDALNASLLQVTGLDAITIAVKTDKPNHSKKVQENVKDVEDVVTGEAPNQTTTKWDYTAANGDDYNDVADYSIGDTVPFVLYSKVPDMTYYDTYKMIFHDDMSAGLTFNPSTVTVKIGTGDTAKTLVKDTDFTVETADLGDTCDFHVVITDLKKIADINKNDPIQIDFTATLNQNAEIGLNGNPNQSRLEYSNNPDEENSTTKTPWDYVVVFTYELDVNKTNGTAALDGAQFVFYREVEKTDGTVKEYVVVDGSSKVTGWTENEAEASTLTSANGGLFKVIGIDDGTYYLKETVAPAGYNLLTDPIQVVVAATTMHQAEYKNDAKTALTALTIDVDNDDQGAVAGGLESGIVSATVVNNKGASLPETGGIGTTLFYMFGGIMAAGSALMLVVRRRADAEEE